MRRDRLARLGAPIGDLSQPPSPMVRISEFGERFLRDMAPRWKPETQKGHRRCIERYIYPSLGSTRVAELTQLGVQTWRESLDLKASTINLVMAVLSGMMRHAEVLGAMLPGGNLYVWRIDAAPLVAFIAAKETDYGTQADGRISR